MATGLTDSTRVITRRSVLGAAAVVATGGVGAVVGVFVSEGRATSERAVAPAPLRQALERELALVVDLDSALRRGAGPAAALRAVRADHAAHAAALRSTLGAYPAPTPPTVTSSSTPTLSGLRAAELAAARAAAAESAALTGADAALLASISACEATHGQLLG
jgi:hypothetical protein